MAEVPRSYVEALEKKGAIKSEAVRRAFEKVPRHKFLREFWIHVDDAFQKHDAGEEKVVYSDQALITKLDGKTPSSSTSQPALVAQMLELLELKPGMKVLEIGTGTGYNAALMAEIVGSKGKVVSIDIQPDVAAQAKNPLSEYSVKVICADGADGSAKDGPFDRIVATIGCPDISWHWLEQLSAKGVILVPLQHALMGHPLVRLEGNGEVAQGGYVGWSGFMSIQGKLSIDQAALGAKAHELAGTRSTKTKWQGTPPPKDAAQDLA
jgi:protein-L-isoaspartate(D-aspartate) O-methyltransferase